MTVIDRATWLVAKREITEGFRSKAVKITLAVSALAVAGLIVVFHLASSGSSESVTEVAVVGESSAADEARLDAVGDAIGTRIVVISTDDDAAARAAVSDGAADVAILSGGSSMLTDEHVDLEGDSKLAVVINVLRADLALSEGLGSAGLSAEEIDSLRTNEPPPVESLEAPLDDDDAGRIGTAIVMNIVLFLLLQTYGGWVISGVTREKASRVVEVLLSTLKTRQLMFGKIIGIGMMALTHAAVIIVVALVTAQVVGLDVLDGFRAGDLAVGGVWFLLGYSLYCCAFAAAGSLCNRAEDAQGVALPIMLPLIAGYIIGFTATDGPNTLLWVLSFFPPTAVLCMPVLSSTGAVPVWAVVLSMAITLAAAYLVGLLAARIYSRSILKTGKRVSWGEALGRKAAEAA
jgi:ABC-2 type transport system permease protein